VSSNGGKIDLVCTVIGAPDDGTLGRTQTSAHNPAVRDAIIAGILTKEPSTNHLEARPSRKDALRIPPVVTEGLLTRKS
jgi:hypothetical protein